MENKQDKPKKKRAEKYDPKVSVNTSFEEVIKLAVNFNQNKTDKKHTK